MILNNKKPTCELSADFQEKLFSIKDLGLIFDILRNKMYSNPILAICREYACNARDAHREVGTPNVPIHIYLPNKLEPSYKIKDFGPGISPDRMENIFIKYTATTKDGDNIQHGAFGLGSKSGFSYSDTFTIKTNINGKQYNYVCFIDETKVGKLVLLSESETKEKNGTEIIIPVKSTDFEYFNSWTEAVARHWDVKPIIKGSTISWKEIPALLKGSNWMIAKGEKYYDRSCKIIIDGIEYALSLDAIRKYIDTSILNCLKGDLYLYFGIGELSLSASRESIYLDKNSQNKIKERFSLVISELKEAVNVKINKLPNLWEAVLFANVDLPNMFDDSQFLKPLKWNNISIVNQGALSVDCEVIHCYKHRRYYSTSDSIAISVGRSLLFHKPSILFINDTPITNITKRYVKKFFEDNPTIKDVQIINCDKTNIQSSHWDRLCKKIHLDKMEPRSLSEITANINIRKTTISTNRLIVFKFLLGFKSFRQIAYNDISGDKKVLCILSKSNGDEARVPLLKGNKKLYINALIDLNRKYPNVSFYGVDENKSIDRLKKDFVFESLDDFIDDKLKDTKDELLAVKYAINNRFKINTHLVDLEKVITPLIIDKNSDFLKIINAHKTLQSLIKEKSENLHIYELINNTISTKDIDNWSEKNPNLNVINAEKLFLERYPLLNEISAYNYKSHLKNIAQYINLIDKV